ncbi:helix-turn-helix domain-containing protein [Kineosporia succinea]|uniref:Excisionase family DNA binding protein n=1 Tax=Kineosporia succinea TaxID=84632 RepID=A0ABT9P260_9ACTN|nr:helix-turn-helix domain-containing protein [Kineosporia succinea]MDP9826763.1 excisionase family DNA binding protein [Kineosporia succinea]
MSTVVRIESNRAVYTVMEVAQLLSLSRGTTYTMIRKGEIPAKKIGDRWVIPKARFNAWLNDLPEATDEDVERALRKVSGDDIQR